MKMRADMGVPANLSKLGVDTDKIDILAEEAIKDPSAGGNPVELTLEDAKALLKEAIGE